MVSMTEIESLADEIAREFNPEKIILFGSYARGTAGPDSDVDLLVILPFEGKPCRKSVEILNRVDAHFPVDLLARNPADTANRYALGDPLLHDAIDHGKILYERCA
jgi:predicted nucleotidyltransferase